MKLHSDKITTLDIRYAVDSAPGAYAEITTAGSRSHRSAWNVSLESNGEPDVDGTTRRRRTNHGTRGASFDRPFAASWSDWGRIIAALYVIDADAVWGSPGRPIYANAEDFHAKTGGRFETDAPAELVASVNSAADAWRVTRGLPA